MRKFKISPNEYYHVLNRGNNKQNIFIDERDWIRFLFLILHFQSSEHFFNLSRPVSTYVRHQVFNVPKDKMVKIIKTREVEVINFCLMPNHFHLCLKEIKEGGISRYMQRVQNAYAKYFNAKYEKSGHLFQGPFRIVHIKTNEQLLHLSAYIHRNVRELKEWENNEEKYPWSSFMDYANENRWGEFLKPDIILGQFTNPKEYENFVDTSGTKLLLEEEILLDSAC